MTADNIEAAIPLDDLTVSPTGPVEAGKGGEGGDVSITNADHFHAGLIQAADHGRLLPANEVQRLLSSDDAAQSSTA